MSLILDDSIRSILTDKLYGKTLVTPSRWAKRCRVMGNPIPGPYDFTYHPWNEEIHDCDAHEIVVMKGAQTGVTETFINRALFCLDQKKQNVFYALPTTTPDAQDFSTARIGMAISLSNYIANMFTRTDRVGLKQTATNTLYLRGVASPNQIRSVDTPVIICDEVDLFPDWSVPLIRQRSKGQFFDQKLLVGCSTPSVDGYGVHAWFMDSTQEHYFFRCPHCNKHIELTWPDCVVITAESHTDKSIYDTHYICPECKHRLNHKEKHLWMHESGVWVPQVKDSNVRGFYINQMYSIPEPHETAADYLRGKRDPYYEQEFWNSDMGMPHTVEGASITQEQINACKMGYTLGERPFPSQLVTMGIDVGKELHYVIKGWKFPNGFTSEEVNEDAIGYFQDIGAVERFLDLDRLVARFDPHMIVIDANPEQREAKSFCLRHPGRAFICYYGRDVKERSANINTADLAVSVNRTNWLDLTLGRYKNKTSLLPSCTPIDFDKHIKALVRSYRILDRKTNDKKPTGEKRAEYHRRSDDHWAHADNYAEIALNLTSQIGTTGNVNMDWME